MKYNSKIIFIFQKGILLLEWRMYSREEDWSFSDFGMNLGMERSKLTRGRVSQVWKKLGSGISSLGRGHAVHRAYHHKVQGEVHFAHKFLWFIWCGSGERCARILPLMVMQLFNSLLLDCQGQRHVTVSDYYWSVIQVVVSNWALSGCAFGSQ